jgi:hypothetical protein
MDAAGARHAFKDRAISYCGLQDASLENPLVATTQHQATAPCFCGE